MELDTPVTPTVLHLDVLQCVREMQQQHGLRISDYVRYSRYCTRKLRRVYRALKFTHGHGRKFVKRPITAEIATDNRHLLITLLQAERSWARAESIREEGKKDGRKSQKGKDGKETKAPKKDVFFESRKEYPNRREYHRLRKLTKAVKYSNELTTIAGQVADDSTRNDAATYQQRITAYYQLAKGEISLSEFRALTSPESPSEDGQSKIKWRGSDLEIPENVKNAQGIIIQIDQQRVQDGTQTWSTGTTLLNTLTDLYDKLFVQLSEATSSAQDQLRNESGDNNSIIRLLNYVKYLQLFHTRCRNLFLVKFYSHRYSLSREQKIECRYSPADIVRLYELLIYNVQELLGLPGVDSDNDDVALFSYEAELFRALALYWKGEGFVAAQQYTQGFACFSYAEELVAIADITARKHKLKAVDSTVEDMVKSAKAALKAQAYLINEEQKQELIQKTSSMSVDEPCKAPRQQWSPLTNDVTNYPPSLLPITVRPIFYDLALHYIENDGEEDNMELDKSEPSVVPSKTVAEPAETETSKTPAPAQPAKKGWLSSLLGGR